MTNANITSATNKAAEFGYTTKVWNNRRLYIKMSKGDLCYIENGAVVMLMDWPRQYHKDEAAAILAALNAPAAPDKGAAIGNEIGCYVPNNAKEINKAMRLGYDYIES
jgi:hypothetical protein